MLDITRYYTDMEKLLYDVGKYVMVNALKKDLEVDNTSPESKKVFKKYYHNDMEELCRVHDHFSKKAPKDWLYVRDFLKSQGLYDESDARRFLALIQRTDSHTDFRAVARRWTQSQIEKCRQDKEVPIYTLRDYVESYNYLVLERRKKIGKKFKGLHKAV